MSDNKTVEELLQRIAALQAEIQFNQSLLENSSDLIYRTDMEGRITYVSPSVYNLSGYTVQEAVGLKMAEEVYLVPEERMYFLNLLQEKGKVKNFEARLKKKDGSVWWASTNAHLLQDGQGRAQGVEGITRDISDLKALEMARREVEERFRLAFHTSPDAINLSRLSDGVFIDVNQGFTDLTGFTREDVLGRSAIEINFWADPEDRQKLVEGLTTDGAVQNLEAGFVRKNGEAGVGLISARVLLIDNEKVLLSVTRDITDIKQAAEENKALENQLIQAQKLEAIGRLAGGVAHDLNNLLVPILGYSESLLRSLDVDDPRREKLHQIIKAGTGAQDLVGQLLAFGRKQTLEYNPLNMNEILTEFETLLRRTIRENIHIEIVQTPDIGVTLADVGQIQQVIMNLALNAADAMPEGGRLTIETAPAELDEEYARSKPGVNPGPYVMLAFSDTGHGMNESTVAQIFEPFFSTKGQEGTGLGLATVYGIVKQHGGNIWVYSEPGRGTTFKVYLPVSESLEDRESMDEVLRPGVMGSETILLVEDNQQVLEIVQEILEQYGYRVLTAQSGKEALEIIAAAGDPVHLLLTDVVMPDMNGKELYARLAGDNPSLRVLFMSGYTANVIVHHGVLDKDVHFIQKPFTFAKLAAKVRESLDR